MTDSPATLLAAGGPKTQPRGRVLAPARYRHPGDVIRLIAAALVLAAAVVIAMLLPALLRPDAAVTGVGPATEAGQVLTGLVQVMIAAAALVLLAAALRYRRFRVLATVAGGFAAAAALMAGVTFLAGPGGPAPAGLRQGSWLAGAGFPDPAVLAGLAAVAVAAAPWLSRPWRRACWAMLLLIGAARLITGGLQPLQLVLAVDVHGRVVTAKRRAAARYRQAQRAADSAAAATALRLAVHTDPAFGLAVADLNAIAGTASQDPSHQQMNWERHHIEVVHAAATGNARRAADLLREHLASLGCDPLAFRIAAMLRQPAGKNDDFENLASHLPGCHATPWPCSP